MAIEFIEVVKQYIWVPIMGVVAGSYEYRLRNRVSRDTCMALHGHVKSKVDEVKHHVDQRFDDHEKFYSKQIDRVIREIKKNNGG